jgi:uncharacterized Ntn-hydrolase superfamily protein
MGMMYRAIMLAAAIGALGRPVSADDARPLFLPEDTTYSIIAVDPQSGELGLGVQSKAFAVGSRVSTGKGGLAMFAHQSSSNPMYGKLGVELLEAGMSPQQALDFMLRADKEPDRRQVAIIDIKGRTAAWTSPKITRWAGHRCATNFCVQGNTLAGEKVIEDMAAAFERAAGPLAERMLAGLDAAEAAGGDVRGKQGAAIYVVKPLVRADYDDRLVDLRVDDHHEPLVELRRLLNVLRSQEMLAGIDAKMKAGQLDEALADALKAQDIAPGYDLAVLAVASVSLRMGKTGDALDSLKKAVEMNPRLKAQLVKNESFASLRTDPTFTALTKID